jgi:hypothetical protein
MYAYRHTTTHANRWSGVDLIKNGRSCDDVRKQMDLKFYAQLAPVLAIGTKIKRGGSIVMTSGTLSIVELFVFINRLLIFSGGAPKSCLRVLCVEPDLVMLVV